MAKIEITDSELDSLEKCNNVQAEIVKVLRPLEPVARVRVLRAVVAYFGYAVPDATASMLDPKGGK